MEELRGGKRDLVEFEERGHGKRIGKERKGILFCFDQFITFIRETNLYSLKMVSSYRGVVTRRTFRNKQNTNPTRCKKEIKGEIKKGKYV